MKRQLPSLPVLAAGLALGALVLTGCASPGTATDAGGDRTGITASGVGTVTGTPDVVTLVLGVQTQGPSANGALGANRQQANALITMLKNKGVADADIRTSQLSVNPSYNSGDGRITGYEVTNQVTATLYNVASAGGIIDAAGEAAGDAVRVQQLTFSIKDDSDLRAKARADAVKQAQKQAGQMAEAAGVRLGKLRSISEAPVSAPPVPMYERSLDAAAGSTPVQPGNQKLTVAVTVVYDIDQ
ncbi:SIMPL domain-containing protein [Pseudonocardia spinosispora]|uniref:SIMPL domain-containing protein n=1 Tax=Pseudonocardia spinosispora TaxID=103441 RepID=UPI00041F21DC|nr:SIMPL domain-containing protein [Pseudonocardia spinosispora]